MLTFPGFAPADDLANEMEDVDFDEEAIQGAEEQAWETEEEDEGVEDGMEAQDDSEVTFSEHSGKLGAGAGTAALTPHVCCLLS